VAPLNKIGERDNWFIWKKRALWVSYEISVKYLQTTFLQKAIFVVLEWCKYRNPDRRDYVGKKGCTEIFLDLLVNHFVVAD
jgi:hypothetical protein